MIAQPHIPYALLPKHFKPKRISNDRNAQRSSLLTDTNDGSPRSQRQYYFKDNDHEHELMIHRRFVLTNSYYERQKRNYHNSYSYGPPQNRSHLSFNTLYTRLQQSLYPQQQFYGFP